MFFFFPFLPPPFSLHSVQGELRAAYSSVKCCEILLVTVKRGISMGSRIAGPNFKVDKGTAGR